MRQTFTLLLLVCFFKVPHSDAQTANSKCEPGRHFVRAHYRRAYIRADGVAVSASEVSAHCADNVKGYSFWNLKLISGRPVEWDRKTEKSLDWTDEEQERTLEALYKIPEVLWPKALRGIHRMNRSKDYPNPASSGDGEIVLYNTAFSSDKNLAQVISHELAHQYFRSLELKDFESYRKATDWFNVANAGSKPIYATSRSNFVQDDGKESLEEDFANNIEYHLFHPSRLRKVTPHATTWIQGHFGDKFKIGTGGAHVQ